MVEMSKMSREKLLSILTIALEKKEYRFLKNATKRWLEAYPGDLRVLLFSAVYLHCAGEAEDAKKILKRLIAIDPVFIPAYLAIADIYTDDENVWGYLSVLTGDEIADHQVPGWAKDTRLVLNACRTGKLEDAGKLIPKLLTHSGRNALVDLAHLVYVHRTQAVDVVKTLAMLYQERWPECIQIELVLADAKMKIGEDVEALEILLECSQKDVAGQTVAFVWPLGNPYQNIWPEIEGLPEFIQIPPSIAAVFGWNLLEEGEMTGLDAFLSKQNLRSEKRTVSKEVEEAKKIFERLAKNLNAKTDRNVDGRYPIYVVLSSKKNLIKKYGEESANVLLAQLQRLSEIIQHKREWGAMLFLPDDAAMMEELGLSTISEVDPWKLKLALQDLDDRLGNKGAMIGALLIVGGPAIIPFHSLPNPTDDVDDIVYSDNPYGCIDANYYVPDWPVGRLPDEKGNDVGVLMQQTRRIIKDHQQLEKSAKQSTGTLAFPFEMLLTFFQQLFKLNPSQSIENTIGYTASIWKRASIGVYRPIGASNRIAVSPPIVSENVDTVALRDAELAYYNLHGIMDGEEWFGQKSYTDVWSGSDFPIALKPSDFVQKGQYQQIIFSEACYGAYINGKQIENSLALKFLSLDAKGFVGSTAIAYGSIQPPLIGADLLANRFWTALVGGATVGESLLQAKHELAVEMQKRQNYLDAEDQKTLISFVLYGDPLAQYKVSEKSVEQKAIKREDRSDEVYLLTEKDGEVVTETEFTAHTLADIKAALETYLPGLEFSDYKIQHQLLLDEEGILAKLSANPPETLRREANGNFIVSFKQKYTQYHQGHQFFTKVTVDPNGKMLKISMSR